jgi:hypothetical protein
VSDSALVWTVAAEAEPEKSAVPIAPVLRNAPRETNACLVILPSSSDKKSEILFLNLGNLLFTIFLLFSRECYF